MLAIRKLPRLFGGEEVFDEAFAFAFSDPGGAGAFEYLEGLYQKLGALGMGNKLMIDLDWYTGNDYYSDIVFSGYVLGSWRHGVKRRASPPVEAFDSLCRLSGSPLITML